MLFNIVYRPYIGTAKSESYGCFSLSIMPSRPTYRGKGQAGDLHSMKYYHLSHWFTVSVANKSYKSRAPDSSRNTTPIKRYPQLVGKCISGRKRGAINLTKPKPNLHSLISSLENQTRIIYHPFLVLPSSC